VKLVKTIILINIDWKFSVKIKKRILTQYLQNITYLVMIKEITANIKKKVVQQACVEENMLKKISLPWSKNLLTNF